MTTDLLFGGPEDGAARRSSRSKGTAEILITIKTAPNPSQSHGETVCVAGIRIDNDHPGWTRLYPINFRDLSDSQAFKKYDVVRVHLTPQTNDSRLESWRPNRDTLTVVRHIKDWRRRSQLVGPYIGGSTCEIADEASNDPTAPSLALIRPADISDLVIESHPGWTSEEQSKIDSWANQMPLFGPTDRRPLQAPRFSGKYKYRCESNKCMGHQQSIIDWEFTAFQIHRLRDLTDSQAVAALREKFFNEVCASDRDTCFYIGNQAKRRHTFSIIGIWWPPKTL